MRVRALLIVNPRATTTTRPVLDFIVRTLAAEADIETVETRYREHARDIAAAAAAEGRDALLVLSGDGTINEVVNGLMQEAPIRAGHPPATAGRLPALGAIPGGNANVFTRDLGLPGDPAAAARVIAARLAAGTTRTIGLGVAGRRYFTSNAGLGWDAEVVRAVEEARARGRRASPGLYMQMALRQYYRRTDRRHPALALETPAGTSVAPLGMALISNTTPWSYIGRHPVSPTPGASFDTGLDVFALRRLRTFATLNAMRQMMRRDGQLPTGRYVVTLHDEAEVTVSSREPAAIQVDGEYVGQAKSVTFRSVPEALRVIA
ncbi:MAG: diacylglycerol/lipid kinase family protein [Streptosporangiaceae bacterium]